MNDLPFILTNQSLSIFTTTGPLTATKENPNFDKICGLIKAKKWEEAISALSPIKLVQTFLAGTTSLRLENNTLYYNDEPQDGYLPNKIIAMASAGFDVKPLTNFLQKLYATPSHRIKEGLYEFLERGNLPITPQGNVLGYRTIRNDYTDWHTGTVDNSIGQSPEMPRNQVDDDPAHDCSRGYHICSQEYLKGFHYGEGRNIVVEFSPGDVVSLPHSDTTKLRVCKYTVLAELPHSPETKNIWDQEVVDEYAHNEYSYDEDGCEEDGYDEDGYDKDGYDKDGYDKNGYDKYGHDEDGYNKYGYNEYGYNEYGYDKYGYNKDGHNRTGYDRDGYDKGGYSRTGYNKYGYDKDGYDKDGYDEDGYNKYGYNKYGYNKYGTYTPTR